MRSQLTPRSRGTAAAVSLLALAACAAALVLYLGATGPARGLTSPSCSRSLHEGPSGHLTRGLPLASWDDIAGCGVGGGAAGGGGVRWIGRRLRGGLLELEALGSASSGEDLTTNVVSLKATKTMPARFSLEVSVPFTQTTRKVTDHPDGESEVGAEGLGDVSLLVSRQFGMGGDVTANLTVGIPTGEYKRFDGPLFDPYYYPLDSQLGTGVVTTSLEVERSFDRDWGPVILGAGYTDNGGENDIGNSRGNTVSAYCYAGYRTERLVHSLGARFSQALEKDRELGEELVDQSDLLVTLQYGLEFSTRRFPLFVAATTTLGEGAEVESSTFALGVMTSF